jgi:hypothetical protein
METVPIQVWGDRLKNGVERQCTYCTIDSVVVIDALME